VTVVLVNGNPETGSVWAPLIGALGRTDVAVMSPPGFGAPVPDDFGATYDDYVAWLVTQLEQIGEPVDLLGHDWGANFVLRLACERPDLLRSWSMDTAGCFAPGYSFPDVCHVWQTAGAGEEAIAAWLAVGVHGRAAINESLGMSAPVAQDLAEAFDETMGRCILSVYRSVPEEVLTYWGQRASAAATRPGLVLIPTQDVHTGSESGHRWLAERAQAKVAVLEGLGHWWMLENPSLAARALDQFWGEG
jgi:pimeloyl-ACP methyl ester carboxylesterase